MKRMKKKTHTNKRKKQKQREMKRDSKREKKIEKKRETRESVLSRLSKSVPTKPAHQREEKLQKQTSQ